MTSLILVAGFNVSPCEHQGPGHLLPYFLCQEKDYEGYVTRRLAAENKEPFLTNYGSALFELGAAT